MNSILFCRHHLNSLLTLIPHLNKKGAIHVPDIVLVSSHTHLTLILVISNIISANMNNGLNLIEEVLGKICVHFI